MLGDDEIYKVMPFILDVKTVRAQIDYSNVTENNYEALAKTPIKIVFIVRYYYCLKPIGVDISNVTNEKEKEYISNQRYAEFTWSSSWIPKEKSILTFEMEEEWKVENIDITAMKVVDDDNQDDNDNEDETESSDATTNENSENDTQDKNESEKK